MTVDLQLWHLITLLLAFFACVAGFAKLLLQQIDARLNSRFTAQDQRLQQIHEDARNWQRIERDLLELRAELPDRYVRREDYIRGQSVIETKLDALALKIENVQLRG